MAFAATYHYIPVEGASLFTMVMLPKAEGKFPTVIQRSPYVDAAERQPESEVLAAAQTANAGWLEHGYAVVFQHCRGRGKSSGDCIPYIHEREDGLALQAWIRTQDFYNGELYLAGGSYCASVHYVTAPFAADIKGAILEVQDTDRYNCNYRNGFYKIGLHGGWYVGMYKRKSIPHKCYAPESYHTLPLSDFSKTVLGERAPDFDAILQHPRRDDDFWLTRFGGGESRDAVTHANIPILFVTGFYDIYTGGIFDMWRGLDEATRAKCALAVHPYDHGGTEEKQPIAHPKGRLKEQFGDFKRAWLDHIRGRCESPFPLGKVTYYRTFEDRWGCDDFTPPAGHMTLPLGEGTHTYRYNPYAPATFKGGLSANFGGTAWQDPPGKRYDVLTFYTPAFERDIFVKGKMSARLCVRSDCEDTCFYMRVSLVTAEGDLGLRDDITQISNAYPDYEPSTTVTLDLSFDDHAFLVKVGQRLRVDVSSSAFPLYVRHTNRRGLFSAQRSAKIATNTVVAEQSTISFNFEQTEG